MLRSSAVLSLAATLLACTSSVGPGEPSANAPEAPAAPAIAKIVTRDRSITLFAAPGSVRATVLDANGRLVARDVDVDALQTIDASAFEACHASYVDRADRRELPDTALIR
jgi:hypothetical protein